MAIYRLLGWNVGITAKTRASLNHMVHVTASRNDRLRFSLAVIGLSISQLAQAAFRSIGVTIDMDKGDGNLSPVLGTELGGEVSLSSSLDGFGVREMSFSRFGAQSPTILSLLRGMRRVVMSGVRGIPGVVKTRLMFDGYTRDAEYSSSIPRTARVTCQDSSVQFSTKPFYYQLAAGSLRYRDDIFIEAMAQNGVSLGTVELPNHGGQVRKPISEGGDRSVTEWARLFLQPTGCRPQWRNGVMNVRRFDTTRAPVRTFGVNDVRKVTIIPPPSNAANAVKMSASIFSFDGPTGTHTLPVDVQEVRGTYAPLTAVLKQDHTTGVQSAISAAIAAADRVISRIETTTTVSGGTIVSQVINEYAWYAPRACPNRQDPANGNTTFNNLFDVYKYADGSWRSTTQEDFQVVRQRVLGRTFDSTTQQLVQETTAVSQFASIEVPIRTAVSPYAAGNETSLDVLLAVDGRAWSGGKESLFAEVNTTSYTVNSAQQITRAFTTVNSASNAGLFFEGGYQIFTPLTGVDSGAVFIFGPATSKRFATQSGNGVLGFLVTAYTPIDDRSHKETTTYQPASFAYPPSFQGAALSSLSATQTVAGTLPYIEFNTGKIGAQPSTVTVNDLVRQALSRGIVLPDFQQNEFCETDGEQRTAALERLRELSAITIILEHAIDWATEDGEVVLLDHPDVGATPITLIAWALQSSFSGATGQNTQSTTCRFYPPELAPN